jgi:hypothetical protein
MLASNWRWATLLSNSVKKTQSQKPVDLHIGEQTDKGNS